MGCGGSTPVEHPSGGASGGRNLRETTSAQAAQDEDVVRMLLLGAGESGKSTIFKQLRILYGVPPNEDELVMYGVVVRSNCIMAMEKLVSIIASHDLEGKLSEEEKTAFEELHENLIESKQAVLNTLPDLVSISSNSSANKTMQQGYINSRAGLLANQEAYLFLKHIEALKTVWASSAMEDAWKLRADYNIIDGHKAFLDNMAGIAAESYRPTQADILLARVRTTAAVKERYHIDGADFEVYDIGGQRSERRKWMEVFDQPVDAVIFVAALSEYDQTLTESRRSNRMVESLELFKSVCNNRHFAETPVILFLNKKDVFAEKILYSNIVDQPPFKDFMGAVKDFDAGCEYFKYKFKDCVVDDEVQDSFIHVTCATDTYNMEFVLDASREIILNQNLLHSGF